MPAAVLTQAELDVLIAAITAKKNGWLQEFIDLANALRDGQQALLDLVSILDPGTALVLPAKTLTQRDAYVSPFEGLLCPSLTTGQVWRYHGGAWRDEAMMARRAIGSWDWPDNDLYFPDRVFSGPVHALSFPNANKTRMLFREPLGISGVSWRLQLGMMMSLASASAVGLRLAYRLGSPGDSLNLTSDWWQASWTPGASKKIVALAYDGWREYTAGASGATGSSEPVWPTSGTVSDGTVTWTAGAVIYKALALNHTAVNAALQREDIDDASLQVPAAEVTSSSMMLTGWFWRDVADTHTGDLYVMDAFLKPVEG